MHIHTHRMLDDGNNMRPIDVSVSDNDVETEPCADEMEEIQQLTGMLDVEDPEGEDPGRFSPLVLKL